MKMDNKSGLDVKTLENWLWQAACKIRLFALGVMEEYHRTGVDVLLYHTAFQNFLSRGYRMCEMGWILEDNDMMNRAIMRIGAVATKRYRVFERSL